MAFCSVHNKLKKKEKIFCPDRRICGAVNQEEIESLYVRFRILDRGRKGYLTGEELLNIPELSINPLNKRLAYFCDGINFKEFVRILYPYSPKASREDKLKHLFAMWDVNGDGMVCKEDVELVMRQAGGSQLSEDELRVAVDKVMEECGAKENGLSFQEFCQALRDAPVDLYVEIPLVD